MISIIICSVNKKYLNHISKNIAHTIGIPYELIIYDNSVENKGICQVYNECARSAKYNILCFSHEDICFHTNNWGEEIIKLFDQSPKIGLLGIAGNSYKTAAPSGWYHSYEYSPEPNIFIVQGSKKNSKKILQNVNNSKSKNPRVAMVDGVWFCTKKEIILKYPFDEVLLKGFHCYDLDLSFNIGQYYEIVTTYNVLIEHFSEGIYDRVWFEETLKLHNKWKKRLPINYAGLNKKHQFKLEKAAFKDVISTMQNYGYSKLKIFMFLYSHTHLYNKVGYGLFFSLVNYLIKF